MDLFDRWATTYERDIVRQQSYPFAGYDDVIAATIASARIAPGHRVLDLGTGTGNVAAQLLASDCEVWGCDFSEEMLRQARLKVPQGRFARFDLRGSWPAQLPHRFDRIVSTYVFHELHDDEKIRLLADLIRRRLTPGGRLAVGDIAFPDDRALSACRREYRAKWDAEEFYWVAHRIVPRLEAERLTVA